MCGVEPSAVMAAVFVRMCFFTAAVFAFPVMFTLFFVMMVSFHGELFDASIRADDFHFGIGRGDLFQPKFFKRDTDSEVGLCFRQPGHLLGFGFVRGWACAGPDHDSDVHQIRAD